MEHLKNLGVWPLLVLLWACFGCEFCSAQTAEGIDVDDPPHLDFRCLPGLAFNVLLYDTEHRAGITSSAVADGDTDGEGLLNEHTIFWGAESGTNGEMEWSEALFNGPYPLNAGFVGLHTSDITQPFASFNIQRCAGDFAPLVVAPVAASQAPYGIRTEERTSTVQVYIEAYIADAGGVASAAIYWVNLEDLFDRNVTVRVEYLPGNALEEVGSQTALCAEFYDRGILAWWGHHIGEENGIVRFQESQLPLGPLRIQLDVDGYESDWVELQVTEPTLFYWRALLAPTQQNPGPSATEILTPFFVPYPSTSQQMRARKWAVTGVTSELTNLVPFIDSNEDSTWDVADFVASETGSR